MKAFSEALFLKVPVVGILRGYNKNEVLKIIEVYCKAGYTNIEITMNTPNAIEIIKEVAKQFKGKLNVGAGTVLNINEVENVISAGGQFIVSPVVDVDVIKHCVSKGIPIFPGAYSPTEIYQAAQLGARMVKVFPATTLGPTYIKDVLGPLDTLELMPTGGVDFGNVAAFIKAGAKAFGMGGNLFKKDFILAQDWKSLENHLLEFKSKLSKITSV